MTPNKIMRSNINYVISTRLKHGGLSMIHGKNVDVQISDTIVMVINPHSRLSLRGAALLNQVSTQRDIISSNHEDSYISSEFMSNIDDALLNKTVRII